MEWSFSPADSQWYNGSTEALVKTIKRALTVTIGQQVFTFSEFQTIMYEVSELANERPIGRKPTHPHDGTYLCPNDLLMGRSTSVIPQGPFSDNTNNTDRYKFIQAVCNNFWKRWSREVFPSLVIQPKWHVQKRNVMVGDIVLLQDSNIVRGEWKMGIVSEITASKDGLIRRVNVTYKRDTTKYVVSRAVQKLIVLVPKDEGPKITDEGVTDGANNGNDPNEDDKSNDQESVDDQNIRNEHQGSREESVSENSCHKDTKRSSSNNDQRSKHEDKEKGENLLVEWFEGKERKGRQDSVVESRSWQEPVDGSS